MSQRKEERMGRELLPKNINNKIGINLHNKENHILKYVKDIICNNLNFKVFDNINPIVNIKDNFDDLLIPLDHPSRKNTDTYYLNDTELLRTHTSAHQNQLLKQGYTDFLVVGDVYRRDEIDRFHYPVFHQVEGISLCDNPKDNLLETLSKLVKDIFNISDYRFVDSYFPFTTPSFELEIKFNDKWLEVLGCGVIHQQILQNCEIDKTGWAFGIGLERWAMILCDIPDIRLFWTEDERFHRQFENGITKFKPYSTHPICYKDIAFWLPIDYNANDFYEIARSVGGDLIESIDLIDSFNKQDKVSHCYRINYRSMDRTLSNEEIDVMQFNIREKMKDLVELR